VNKYRNKRVDLENQQKQEKLLNNNDNLFKLKSFTESVRGFQCQTSKNFGTSPGSKNNKKLTSNQNTLQTEIDIMGFSETSEEKRNGNHNNQINLNENTQIATEEKNPKLER